MYESVVVKRSSDVNCYWCVEAGGGGGKRAYVFSFSCFFQHWEPLQYQFAQVCTGLTFLKPRAVLWQVLQSLDIVCFVGGAYSF